MYFEQNIGNKCAAKFENIPTCAKYMDILLSHKFFEKKGNCRCKKYDFDCQDALKSISINPCFISIKFLRLNNSMPILDKKTVGEYHQIILD